jgi:hypothetical protein
LSKFTILIFDKVSVLVKKYVSRANLSEMEIHSEEYRRLFLWVCDYVDGNSPAYWDKYHRDFVKKAALVFCSKVGSDGAFDKFFQDMCVEFRKTDIMVKHK